MSEEFEGETRETEIEGPGSALFEARGWVRIKIMRAQKNGFPDSFFGRARRAIFVEWKRPGKDATKQQKLRHKELRDAGFEVYVVDNLIEADVISR